MTPRYMHWSCDSDLVSPFLILVWSFQPCSSERERSVLGIVAASRPSLKGCLLSGQSQRTVDGVGTPIPARIGESEIEHEPRRSASLSTSHHGAHHWAPEFVPLRRSPERPWEESEAAATEEESSSEQAIAAPLNRRPAAGRQLLSPLAPRIPSARPAASCCSVETAECDLLGVAVLFSSLRLCRPAAAIPSSWTVSTLAPSELMPVDIEPHNIQKQVCKISDLDSHVRFLAPLFVCSLACSPRGRSGEAEESAHRHSADTPFCL